MSAVANGGDFERQQVWYGATGSASATSGTATWGGTATLHNCYDYWHHNYWPLTTVYYPPGIDKGERAFTLAQDLIDKKLVKVTTVKDFIALMNALMKAL